jgi:hypothetical protein
MTRWLIAVSFVVVSGILVVAQSADQEVLKAEQARLDARRKGDAAAHTTLVSDDFLQVTNGGAVQDKKYAVSLAASPKMALRDLKTRLYGDVAVVNGVQTGSGPKGELSALFTHIWLRRNGRWLNAFVHNTPISKSVIVALVCS